MKSCPAWNGASSAKLDQLEEEWRSVEKAAREPQAKAESIEDAVYDPKAVNPTARLQVGRDLDAVTQAGHDANQEIQHLTIGFGHLTSQDDRDFVDLA